MRGVLMKPDNINQDRQLLNISLPQSVKVCSLHVRISAGNSAGMHVCYHL